jgi:predicted DNA-binding protein with PD1-like motif
MRFQRFGGRVVVRIESGERVAESLLRLLRAEDIGYAVVSGLGAVCQIRLSYWNAESRQYEAHEMEEQMEVVSLTGNVTLRDGEPFLHVHIALGRQDLSVLGGHFSEAVAHPTLEVWLQRENEPVPRVPDATSGLALMELPEQG